jgi:hypothetical protein
MRLHGIISYERIPDNEIEIRVKNSESFHVVVVTAMDCMLGVCELDRATRAIARVNIEYNIFAI